MYHAFNEELYHLGLLVMAVSVHTSNSILCVFICLMLNMLGLLTTGGVDDISQLSILPLAEVVLFHTSSSLGCLHLRTSMEKNR